MLPNMSSHNPVAFAHEFAARLASRSRHVSVFLGAGASKACGLPTITELQEHVGGSLLEAQRKAFEAQLDGRNLEEVLSRLRRISALLEGQSSKVDNLNAETAANLDAAICEQIVTALDINRADLRPMQSLASWAASGLYHAPIEVFTVNYDLLIETAFEEIALSYFDGFVGTMKGRFRTDLVESHGVREPEIPASFVRLWKIHGSVNWAWQRTEPDEIVRTGSPVTGDVPAAIYPSDAKYEESKRVPFVVLHDRLRRSLEEPETLAIVSGYSFSDQHLNELFFDAARRRPRSEVIAFCWPTIPTLLAEMATKIPNLQAVAQKEAIIGTIRGEWDKPDDPPLEVWDEGFRLCDFSALAAFLSRSTSSTDSIAGRLDAAVRGAGTEGN